METEMKNVKISQNHHDLLKTYCDNKGLKIYRVLEKFIEDLTKPKEEKLRKRDLYGDD